MNLFTGSALFVLAVTTAVTGGEPESRVHSMHIIFERSGGFTGVRMTSTFDSDTISSEEADKLHNLIESATFFELPVKVLTPQSGADRFSYKLTIEMGGRRHAVEIEEAAAPPTLRPLLDWLTAKARERRHQ